MPGVKELPVESLYRNTDPKNLNFETTDDLDGERETIGQPRAVEAVQFGTGIEQEGYNIFAMGPTGIGKRELIRKYFEQRAAKEPNPSDWVYVNNFKQRHKPQAIEMPAGKGSEFAKDMDDLIEDLRAALSAAFESEEYRTRKQIIEQDVQQNQEQALEGLQQKAREKNFALLRTPAGLVFTPVKEGEVISPEEFQSMPEEERKRIESELEELQKELQDLLQQVPRLQRDVRNRMHDLNREFINYAVGSLIDELQEKYKDNEKIVHYLDDVEEDVIENAKDFLREEEEPLANEAQNPMAMLMQRAQAAGSQQDSLDRFKVNVFLDRSKTEGAPVVYEDNPTYQNLIGRVDHLAQMGALLTNFMLLKPGALHEANGGYLILDARKVLLQPYAWEALKRALDTHQVKVESVGQMLSLISTVSLEPEPIPIDIKIALFGDRQLYYLLSQYDPDFTELFKVQADFEEEMDRNDGNQMEYARMIACLAKENQLRPFNRSAVARVIEHSSRLVSDAEKLSTRVESIADLMREADYWAGKNGHDGVVTAADVQKAIDHQIYRSDRIKERIQETILRGTFLIDTEGSVVGQVNGLSVLQLGGFSFGRPSRITARVRMGKGDVVNIEREVELSGPIHSKGVLILSSFMAGRYATERPLSLSASLVFEQSYGGVDGDSASSAELYALLSAISEVPIRQSLAVTGSVNQHGHVQAIGGVNDKVEGFYDICKARGLTGDQGVLIPESNVKHLMLRWDVVESVRSGQFHIYPISNVDEGIEMLTGMTAGEPDENGNYPPDTINGKVQRRLAELAEKRAKLEKEKESEA